MKRTRRDAIVVEQAEPNHAADVPDLPGCVATGATVEATKRLVREAIVIHVEGLRVPEPSSVCLPIGLSGCLGRTRLL